MENCIETTPSYKVTELALDSPGNNQINLREERDLINTGLLLCY